MKCNAYFLLVSIFVVFTNMHSEFFSLYDGQNARGNTQCKQVVKSGHFELRQGGDYQVMQDGPMIQLLASGVTINLNHYSVNNTTQNNLLVAIEVGYSQEYLDMHKGVQQISNVIIKNACFTNFDVGILVHPGVNNITIENCKLDGVSCGIVFIGKCNEKSKSIIKATVKDCTVLGHSCNHYASLMKLKKYIEVQNQAGEFYNNFMPMFKDFSIGSNEENVYTYTGIFANFVHGLELDNVYVQSIGYSNYQKKPEGDGFRTMSAGIWLNCCAGVFIKDSTSLCCSSELQAVGLKLYDCPYVTLEHCDFLHQHSVCKSYGIEVCSQENVSFVNDLLYLTSVRSDLHCVEPSQNNFSQKAAAGIFINGNISVEAKDCIFSENSSEFYSYGLCADKIKKSKFLDCCFNKNMAHGEVDCTAIGCFVNNAEGIVFEKSDFSRNAADNKGVGLLIKNSINVSCIDILCIDNQGIKYAKNERADNSTVGSIRYEQDRTLISHYAPVVDAAQTGGYGAVVQNCKRVGFDRSRADNNSGHRSAGFVFMNSSLVTLKNSIAQYQYAYGNYLYPQIDVEKTKKGTFISIVDPQQYVLSKTSPELLYSKEVNLSSLIDRYLKTCDQMYAAWEKTNNCPDKLCQQIIDSIGILSSVLSRYRMWGTAIGAQFHNCTMTLVQESKFIGQISQYDSAIGCAVTGQSQDFYIQDSEFSYNGGWIESNKIDIGRAADYQHLYNLSSIKPVWDIVAEKFDKATDDGKGFVVDGHTVRVQGDKVEDPDSCWVGVLSKNNFSCPIAPITAGLIMGDVCSGGSILRNNLHCNKSNAGFCYGLLFHLGENFLVQSNSIKDNASNIYGYCAGLMEISSYSQNSYMQNQLSFNRVDNFYNSHVYINSDERKKISDVYPKTELNNGKKERVTSDLDNVHINFPMTNANDKKNAKKSV